jgi:hypothetical protein
MCLTSHGRNKYKRNRQVQRIRKHKKIKKIKKHQLCHLYLFLRSLVTVLLFSLSSPSTSPQPSNVPLPTRIRIRCCAAPCNVTRGPFDHFEIRVSTLRFELARISKWSNVPCAALHGAAQQRIRILSHTWTLNFSASKRCHKQAYDNTSKLLSTMYQRKRNTNSLINFVICLK